MGKRRIQLISLLIALALFVIQSHETGTARAFSKEEPLKKMKETAEKVTRSLIKPEHE